MPNKKEYLNSFWKNNKNGEIYLVIDILINTTNSHDGVFMVEYIPLYDIEGELDYHYVRELPEFEAKFTKIQSISVGTFNHDA